MTRTETEPPKAASLAQWKGRNVHNIALPSGAYCDIKLPNIPKLVAGGQIPNELVEVASLVAQGGSRAKEVTGKELLTQHAEFTKFIVAKTVVKPEVKEEEVELLPYEDQEFLVEVATRNRDLDALGHHIGGLHTQSDFRRFRNLPDDDAGLASL